MNSNKAAPDRKLKFLCSYGGKIQLRQSDGELRYSAGHTRILAVDRSVSFSELMVKLGELCGFSVNLKCQLPGGDLETLISIKSDEELGNLIEEYDRASPNLGHSLKIKAILTPPKSLKIISPLPSSVPSFPYASVSESPPFKTPADSVPNSQHYRYDPHTSRPPVRFSVDHRNCFNNRPCCCLYSDQRHFLHYRH